MYRLFLIPIILKISKINVWVLFPPWDFRGPGIPAPPPPQGKEGHGAPRIPKWEILEYCNTIKITLKFFLNLSKKKELFKKVANSSHLYSFLLTITAVICWSMKMRMVARIAKTGARNTSTHQGLASRWSGNMRAWVTSQLLPSQVGLNSLNAQCKVSKKYILWECSLICSHKITIFKVLI